MRKGQWQKAHHYLNTALNGYDDRLHKCPGFADKVARLSLLALILGEGHAQWLMEWGRGLDADSTWVMAAEKILEMAAKQERVRKAKELLTGAKESREFEGTFDEWLGDPARGRGGGRLEGRAVRGIS